MVDVMKKSLIPLLFGKRQASRIWTPQGYALEASTTADQLAVQEPSVIYEGGTFYLWYSYGYTHSNRHIGLATGTDGINFTRYASNPVVTGYTRAFVFKNGAQFVMYALDEAGGTGHHKFTSSDGITWTNAGAITMTGASQSFESSGMANICVWVEDTTWHMMYEAYNGSVYSIGHATSSNSGMTFAGDAANPVMTYGSGSISGPFVQKIGSKYVCWVHVAASGVLPTDICRYQSTDLANWTRNPPGLTIPRADADDGGLVATTAGQTADLHLCEVNGVTYAYYTDCWNGGLATAGIRVAKAQLPIASIAKSKEGLSGSYQGSYLYNCGFERVGAGGADIFEKWTETASDGTIARSNTAGEFHSGTSGLYGLKLTAGAGKNTQIKQDFSVGTFPGNTLMTITGWAKGDGTNRGRVRFFSGSDVIADWGTSTTITNTTTWTQFAIQFTSPANGGGSLYLYCPNAVGGIAYFDDVRLISGSFSIPAAPTGDAGLDFSNADNSMYLPGL